MKFAEKLKTLRKSKGLTQMQLAAATNMSLGVVADIESGRHNPSKTSAVKLANYFNVPVQVFILEDEELPTNKRHRTFAEKIKLLRNSKHMTQMQLAEATGVSLGVVAGVESGRRPPSKEMARRLSEFFKVPVEIFVLEKIDLEQNLLTVNIPTKTALEIDEIIQRIFCKTKKISIQQRAAIIESFFANNITEPAEIEKLLVLQDALGIEQILANE